MKYRILFVFIIFSASFLPSVQASDSDNVSGYVWSENIGWISFSGDDYGVTINSNGNFSGYAWSENIGWIQFNPTGPYPVSPNYSACLDLPGNGQACDEIGNYNVGGWARVLANGGGWDGWIKLRGSNYGVLIDQQAKKFEGYAWSDMVAGWVKFDGIGYGVETTFPLNSAPDKPNKVGDGEIWDNCSFAGKSIPTFNWTYSDPDGDLQVAYEIEADDNSGFAAPKFNHLVNLPATSYTLDLSQDDNSDWISSFNWNATYFWRVRVKDNQGNWSSWSSSDNFKTPNHAYPFADFIYAPASPGINEMVNFTDQSQAFGGADIEDRSWVFDGGDPDESSLINPSAKFDSSGAKQVSLEVKDSSGYECNTSKTINITLSPPKWKEIPPF